MNEKLVVDKSENENKKYNMSVTGSRETFYMVVHVKNQSRALPLVHALGNILQLWLIFISNTYL